MDKVSLEEANTELVCKVCDESHVDMAWTRQLEQQEQLYALLSNLLLTIGPLMLVPLFARK